MTLMSSVFFNKVGFSLNASPTQPGLPKLPPDILGPIEDKIKNGVVWAFISILPIHVDLCPGSHNSGQREDSREKEEDETRREIWISLRTRRKQLSCLLC